ncbi:MAG TPA: calcium-binding protein [Stellaceae bacterium]
MADIIGDDNPNTFLTGTEDADFLWGMGGFDGLIGLGGDDVYLLTDAFVLVGFDTVTEAPGGGNDTVIVQADPPLLGFGDHYVLTDNVENGIIGGVDTLPPEVQGTPPDAPFTLIGNALDNTLTGNRAANTLEGGDGADTLDGKAGLDTLIGGAGDDTYILSDVSEPVIVIKPSAALIPILTLFYDTVTEAAGGGTDTVIVTPIAGTDTPKSYTLSDNVENGIIAGVDTGETSDLPFSLSGNALDNSLTGNRAANTLQGNAGADILNGGVGLDTLVGGAGDDTYLLLDVSVPVIVVTGRAAIPALTAIYDTVTEAAGGGTDTVVVNPVAGADAPKSYTLGDNIENGIVAGVDTGEASDLPFSLFGNALDNALTGNRAANTLNGGAGADTLNGGAGLDTLIGGAGDDTYLLLDVSVPVIVVTGRAAIPVLTPIYDTVTEAADGGTDTVIVDLVPGADTPRSYTLGPNIENGTAAGADTTGATSDLPISLVGNALDNALTGNNAGNTLSGGAGADILDGKAGLDTLIGGPGDDVYLVLDATDTLVGGPPIPHFETVYDTVTEAAGGGTDTVVVTRAVGLVALTSYTLGPNVENGVIGGVDVGLSSDEAFSLTGNALANALFGNRAANTLKGGAGADTLKGRAGADTLIGGGGNDTLDGGTGADKMAGGSGNDTYIVGNAGDVVTESLNQGSDTVRTTRTSYTLGANIENLVFAGSRNFTGTGNGLANKITGGSGSNTLSGGGGADTLTAGRRSVMTGGSGADRFLFTTPGSLAMPDANKVTDFTHTADRLVFRDAGFNLGIDEGKGTAALQSIAASLFSARTDGTFATAGNRFAYNRANGGLYYDANGSGGGSSRLLVATLTAHPTLTATDLFFIA